MISRIEVRNYRSLRSISQGLDNFHILIGPNASGKTTFLDVIGFISEILNEGLDSAIEKRSSNFLDLTFCGQGGEIEFAIELALPQEIANSNLHAPMHTIRYEIALGLLENEHAILEEKVLLLSKSVSLSNDEKMARTLFPDYKPITYSLITKRNKTGNTRFVISKKRDGNDNFYPETAKESGKGKGYMPSFKLGSKRSALVNLPSDETKFPAATWLKETLMNGVQFFILDSQNIRKASPPGKGKGFRTDGSNLPWVINELKRDSKRFSQWVNHLITALPDIEDVMVTEREDDKHLYLSVKYQNGSIVPSWLVSDGTLRLLALTLPAYLKDFKGVYLIEEPENGIHPKAIEAVFQSLSSVYKAQILLASHSPVLLGLVERKQVLCFAKTPHGETDIVRGDQHPILADWKDEFPLTSYFVAGVLS